jgi:hypothetical protein
MSNPILLDEIYASSGDVVAREIGGEFMIVPLTAGIGDVDDALFSLNDTGHAIWTRLDGNRTLREVAVDLATIYSAPLPEIEADVVGLVEELTSRRMLVRV